jgi:hypothetical protein
MKAVLTGGCLCGRVRYEADGTTFHETICHCSMCRRASGAPLVAWFSVQRDAFRLAGGTPTRYASSARGTRCFCPTCGTQLTFESVDHLNEIDVTTASLDEPGLLSPKDHVHVATRLPWIRLCDGLPTYPDARPSR